MSKNNIVLIWCELKLICATVVLGSLIAVSAFASENTSLIVNKVNSPYASAIREQFPLLAVHPSLHTSAFQSFYNGQNVEAYETQASALVEAKSNYHFEAHYIHTVVIAVDRSQTNEKIENFQDVIESNSQINFNFGEENGLYLWDLPSAQQIVLSMAYALYGNFNINSIASDFYKLNKENRFNANDETKPISIMRDFEAVELLQNGRNIEIIIPKDGTLSFVGGILAKDNVQLYSPDFRTALLDKGLRLPNGEANKLYPETEQYKYAKLVENFSEYNKAASVTGYTLRREAFETERYGFTDHKARAVFFLSFLIFMMFYIISINRRLINSKIRSSIILVCCFQIILSSMGCLKALNFDNPIVETILWYGYYYAFIYIVVIYLYVALFSGKNSDTPKMNSLFKLYIAISTLLVLLVSTNNFHGFVFTVYDYRFSIFDYNTGYYVVMSWICVSTCVALSILVFKVTKMPRKTALLMPYIMNIFTIIFAVGYIRRIPLFYDLDFAYSINIIILLYIESAVQSKLLATNTYYKKMFSNSHLRMEIRDIYDKTVEHSLLSNDDSRNYVLKRTSLLCGSFLYYEDYTDLNIAREKLKITNAQLEDNNSILKIQGGVAAERASLAAEKVAYEYVDSILSKETVKIGSLLEEMKHTKNLQRLMGQINVVTCAIKRKCILQINTLYKKQQTVEDFLNSIGEMREFAKLLPLTITIGCRYTGEITLFQSMVMYELYCDVIEVASIYDCSDILVQLYEEDSKIIFSIIPDRKINVDIISNKLSDNIVHFDQTLSVKAWYDSTAVLLSFPKEVKELC